METLRPGYSEPTAVRRAALSLPCPPPFEPFPRQTPQTGKKRGTAGGGHGVWRMMRQLTVRFTLPASGIRYQAAAAAMVVH